MEEEEAMEAMGLQAPMEEMLQHTAVLGMEEMEVMEVLEVMEGKEVEEVMEVP
jgi:hypothetical protein